MSATVLVVDDSASVRQQVGATLRQSGFDVAEAQDGLKGLTRIEQGGIDCVICDVNMPIMDGIEMVRQVMANPKCNDLPIIMLTTEGAKDMIVQAKKAGAKGWIVKPFNADMLIAAVAKLTNVAV